MTIQICTASDGTVFNYCSVCGWISENWRSRTQAKADANEHVCWSDGKQDTLAAYDQDKRRGGPGDNW